jgi:D-alanyl-lipoteichoic acid acyltransferase DltB (MBOAT superfamily)
MGVWVLVRNRTPWVGLVVLASVCFLGWTRSEAFVQHWTSIQFAFEKSFLSLTPIVPLVGVSYFILRALSLVFESRKGKIPQSIGCLETLNYLLFFPTLISGPIDRFARFQQDLQHRQTMDSRAWDECLWRIVLGLFKKFVLANTLALYAISNQMTRFETLSTVEAWLAFYAWAGVLYLDFSGYCDVSISVGRLLGFRVCENFRMPYLSGNITEFWRRWHISLSEWLRDYVFLPVGMFLNRRLKGHSLLAGCGAVLVTFTICGLWHGFEFRYLLWGILHGSLVFSHKLYQELVRTRFPKGWTEWTHQSLVWKTGCVFLTFHGVALSWIFFATPDVGSAFNYVGRMLGV